MLRALLKCVIRIRGVNLEGRVNASPADFGEGGHLWLLSFYIFVQYFIPRPPQMDSHFSYVPNSVSTGASTRPRWAPPPHNPLGEVKHRGRHTKIFGWVTFT